MRQLIKIFILSLLLIFNLHLALAELRGGVDYQIPIDYTKLNQAELEAEAKTYYGKAIVSKKLNDDMTKALNIYTMLSNAAPDNAAYALKLGKLYDVLGKDRYAKGNYYRAMGIDKSDPEPYCYLGDFYYDREQYRKALNFYTKAYDRGYSVQSHTLDRISDIRKRLGDSIIPTKYPVIPSDVPTEIIEE